MSKYLALIFLFRAIPSVARCFVHHCSSALSAQKSLGCMNSCRLFPLSGYLQDLFCTLQLCCPPLNQENRSHASSSQLEADASSKLGMFQLAK